MSQASYQLREGATILEKHEGIGNSEMFRHIYLGSQYGESWEKSHALDQTFILPRGNRDLQKKALVVHDSTQDPLVLQLFKEAWPSYKEDPRHPSKQRQSRSLACNSILEKRIRLNNLTFLSPPWHTGWSSKLVLPSST
ncbi:hypothetical protein ACFX13_013681 [Malus domestica]